MDLIGIPEAAEILGLDRTTVWRWVAEGALKPSVQVNKAGGKRKQAFFDRAYIEEKAKNRVQQAAAV